mmetsp:Transcript_3210/g.7638  ORF Transcript_3210/g.7638 Transcript_3210/m.7638 type:complete len:121 (+) Transcript_3210:128-490(+)
MFRVVVRSALIRESRSYLLVSVKIDFVANRELTLEPISAFFTSSQTYIFAPGGRLKICERSGKSEVLRSHSEALQNTRIWRKVRGLEEEVLSDLSWGKSMPGLDPSSPCYSDDAVILLAD